MVQIAPSTAPAPTHTSAPPNTSAAAIAARSITKTYSVGNQRLTVLDNVDFHADPGQCVFLVGPSGSGKSTLLSILGCLLGCDSGELFIGGDRVDDLCGGGQTRVRRDKIGFVFQRFQLFPALSARDNIALPLTMHGASKSEAREQADLMLRRIDLFAHADQRPTSMSPGQCQRVAMARALIHRPAVVLADEPTAALDSKSGQTAMTLMKELVAGSGSAIVVVTHDPRIEPFADRICRIEAGKLI